MSLVGPRPLLQYLALYSEEQKRRHETEELPAGRK
jgi:lipopolysaccharide/colanic/teichoic acid biosynthesis glycosyltransferase